MLMPDASSLELMLEAPRDPLTVLRVCQARLIEARDLAIINFDEWAAAEIIREMSAILGKVAEAMKAHAVSPPFGRPSRAQINAAVKALEEDANASPAWKAL